MSSTGEYIASLDVGSSSVRMLLFDGSMQQVEDVGAQTKYRFETDRSGGVEIDGELLFRLLCEVLDQTAGQMRARSIRPSAVAFSTFWHCFLGVDDEGAVTTPIIHLFDTRSHATVAKLRRELDPVRIHQETGCMPHSSYWPAKLLWLRAERFDAFVATSRWMSVGEFLLFRLTGKPGVESISMVSASGMWNQFEDRYEEELLQLTGLKPAQLAPVETLDEPVCGLSAVFAKRWPELDGISWYPAYGDGACNNVGSGCTTEQKYALMIGTSGAIRVVTGRRSGNIPAGLWCYRVSRERFVYGGAISNGGSVYRWANDILKLPDDAESQIALRRPGCHGLTMLPFLAGERSPYWRPDLRAMITGITLSTTSIDMLQALLEGVSVRFKQIYDLLTHAFGTPAEIVASGGAIVSSETWLQLLADALGHAIEQCSEGEASSRGAAILVAEQLKWFREGEAPVPVAGRRVQPDRNRSEAFEALSRRDEELFNLFYNASARSPLDVFQ